MIKFIVLFLFFPILLTAQSKNFKIGFGLNSGILGSRSDGNNNVTVGIGLPIPLFNYSLNFKYIINNDFSLHPKLGYALPISYYNGFEYGISGEYNFKKNYYASVGFIKHNNSEHAEYAVEASINFINAGFGYKVSKYLSIEAIYFYPLNREIIYNRNIRYPHIEDPKAIGKIESMIYLSFIFGWEL